MRTQHLFSLTFLSHAHALVRACTPNLAALNLQIARTYLFAADPKFVTRIWDDVFDAIIETKTGSTRERWDRAVKDQALEPIRKKPLLQTTSDDFLSVLRAGTVATNVFLRRIHNFALDMNWIPCPIVPKKKWIAVKFKEKRAVTSEEHKRIVEREQNPERKAFYELCWHLGGSQSDIASLHAEDVNWESRQISYRRKKTGESAHLRFGEEIAQILKPLPEIGPLFPYLIGVRACDRATEFKKRCQALGIAGITLHSYRYSWAERAKACGYPERYAQLALGHNSKAVHRAYAKKAKVSLPSLEDYEKSSAPLTIAPSAA